MNRIRTFFTCIVRFEVIIVGSIARAHTHTHTHTHTRSPQVVYSAFEETTASTQQLESDTYLSVQDRLRIEKSKDDLLSMAKR